MTMIYPGQFYNSHISLCQGLTIQLELGLHLTFKQCLIMVVHFVLNHALKAIVDLGLNQIPGNTEFCLNTISLTIQTFQYRRCLYHALHHSVIIITLSL